MSRSRSFAAAATAALFAACFTDLGVDTSGTSGGPATTTIASSTGAPTTTTSTSTTTTTDTTTTDTTTTATTTTTAPLTTGPETSTTSTGPTLCGNGIVDPGEACDDGNQNGDDGCPANCQLEGCGDGELKGDEECDDGNAIDEDGCVDCNRKFFHVFVTSSIFAGDLGLVGADQQCGVHAQKAGLPGVYLAWMATSDADSPKARFTKSTVPYVLPDRATMVANNFDALFLGVAHPINQDEEANTLMVDPNDCSQQRTVWTGIGGDGTPADENCLGWTSSNGVAFGHSGYLDQAVQWTSACISSCDRQLHLYCFQQGP